jgi:hypothetical protein
VKFVMFARGSFELCYFLLLISISFGQDKTGTVIVYRPSHFSGAGVSFSFRVDNGPWMKLKNGYYWRLELPAGEHIIEHPNTPQGWSWGRDPQTIRVQAGSTVYFACFFNMGVGCLR